MLLNIDLYDSVKELPKINIIENVVTTNNKTSLSANLEPKQILLNKETIIQLQETYDCTVLQISSKKEDINFNGTPRLEWLKGRDDILYNETIYSLSVGRFMMNEFSEIVEKTKNSESINHKDWKAIMSSINGFENGYTNNRKNRANTNDSIIHKVLDYISPKTQQRIDVLKQFLATKTKEPEIEFAPLKDVDIKENTNITTINNTSCEKTNSLLDFLVKDLKWYKWFLEDKKEHAMIYSSQLLQLSYSRQLEILHVN